MQQWILDFLSFLCGLIINWWWGFNHCVCWSICDLVWLPAQYGAPSHASWCTSFTFQRAKERFLVHNTSAEENIFSIFSNIWKERSFYSIYGVRKCQIFISSAIAVKCLLLMWHWAMSCDKFPVSVKVTSATLDQGKSRLAHSHRRAILIVRCFFKWPAASFALLGFSISL